MGCKVQTGNGSSQLLLPVLLPQILIPALMVTAEKDVVLVPEMSKHMEDWVREWSCSGLIGASWERAQVSQRKDGSRGHRVGCLFEPLA